MPTKKEEEKTLDSLEDVNQLLKNQVSIYQELMELKNEEYFKKILLDKIERIATALENSLDEEEKVPEIKPKEE
jgi:hypothetical protein